MMYLFVLVVSTLVANSYQQQLCSSSPLPDLNGACPSGTTLVTGGCCTDADLYTPTTTTPAPTTTTVQATTAASSTCVDLLNPKTGVSDCPGMAAYCTNAVYLSLMKTQCPKTCGYCSSSGTATTTAASSSRCVDLINASTGTSDCPRMAAYCTNSVYLSLMKVQCPKTCGFCSSSGTVTTASSSTCADLVNPSTGVSDCARNAALCNNATYKTLMQQQCKRTCGYC